MDPGSEQNGSGHERRTKRRFDSGGANQDESGSSRPDVISGKELRPRDRKRAVAADTVKESDGGSSSDEDDVEDSLIGLSKGVGRLQQKKTVVRKVRKGKKVSLI